ncbi:DUF4260 family protein [Methylocystis sp. IM3]|uniref:DUF4260 family protein n=1 Tax=unclassified Methylocystis TaxID=2625913 RepID=UPI0030F9BF8C
MQADSSASGFVSGAPKLLLRSEGAARLAAALFFYASIGGGWVRFAFLLLAPGLSLLAHFAGPRAGASGCIAAHKTTAALAYGALGAPIGQALR